MTGARRRIAALYLVAVAGVLVCLVLGAWATGSRALLAAALGVTVLVGGGLAVVTARLVRAARAQAERAAAGRTCSCCTTTHSDPVQVV